MNSKTKIVLADDMEPILLYLEKILSDIPEFEVIGKAKNGNELVDLVINNEPQLVITDVEMPGYSGIQAIEKLNELKIKTKYILVTGNGTSIMTCKAKSMGVIKIITKPITNDEKFIEQVKEVVSSKGEEEILIERVTPCIRACKNGKENILSKIVKRVKGNR